MAPKLLEEFDEFELEALIEAAESSPFEEDQDKNFRLRKGIHQLKAELVPEGKRCSVRSMTVPPEQDYAAALEPKEREAIRALLTTEVAFNLMLCGSPIDILLGLTKSLCQEAHQKAFTINRSNGLGNRFDEALRHSADEGSIFVFPNKRYSLAAP